MKTEHAGAKNGGGFYGRRAEAKSLSNIARRQADKAESWADQPGPEIGPARRFVVVNLSGAHLTKPLCLIQAEHYVAEYGGVIRAAKGL